MKCKISIVIPVYKEANIINESVKNIRKIGKNYEHEIIVVDCEDNESTIKCLLDKGVKKLISKKGRAKQMNCGAKQATGDILVFLHADTFLPDCAFEKIIETIKIKGYNAGAFDLKIKTKNIILKIIAFFSSLRSRITMCPYGDQVHFFEKRYFFKLKQYEDIPLMEDVAMMKKIRKDRGKIYIIPEKAVTSDRKWKKEGIFYCTLRNWFISILFYFGEDPNKLVKYYY